MQGQSAVKMELVPRVVMKELSLDIAHQHAVDEAAQARPMAMVPKMRQQARCRCPS